MKFFIETIGTVKHLYIVEAEDMETAVDTYSKNQDTLHPAETDYLGELISDVNGVCDEHYQEYLEAKAEDESESEVEDEKMERIHRSMN